MDGAPLPDLDALDRDALLDLIRSHEQQFASMISAQDEEIRRLEAELDAQRQMVSEQAEELDSRRQRIEHLRLMVEKFRHMIFGKKSEKLVLKLEQMEFELEEDETTQAEAEAIAERISPRKEPKPRSERKPLPEHLKREEKMHKPDSDCCPDCGGGLRHFGDDVSEQLEYVPESFKVIRHVRPKFTCTGCDLRFLPYWFFPSFAPRYLAGFKGLRSIDVGVGAFFSNMVMFFIILTTAITLNRHGITNIETSRQAAAALRPFAGNFAATLFTLGIVGVGFLAIPTLAGSTAYAFAETLGWRQGLNKKLRQTRWFYALILFSTAAGVGLDFIGINPVKALYWTAIINGLLAPFLLVAILMVAADKKLMQGQPSSRLGWIVVALTTIAMFAAGVAMFVV